MPRVSAVIPCLNEQDAIPLVVHGVLSAGIRDVIVVVLHAIYFGLVIFIWAWWQKRGQVKTTEIEVSSFGRPLVKKA